MVTALAVWTVGETLDLTAVSVRLRREGQNYLWTTKSCEQVLIIVSGTCSVQLTQVC